jgi:short-subunit dehydrogenase
MGNGESELKLKKGDICLVTGASSGIGLACARLLKQRGLMVYGTSRGIPAETVEEKNGIYMIGMDVTDGDSVARAVALILSREGRIDLVVNNAGSGVSGSVEETPLKDAIYQMDVCFFGGLRVIKEVLPHMRKNGGGRIINIGSVAAAVSIPYQIMYSAAKAAVRSLSAALRLETTPFGVEVCVVEPGDTKTGFTSGRKKIAVAEDSPYAERYARSIARMERDEQNGVPPEKVANTVSRAAFSRKMKPRITVGFSYKAIDVLYRLLPASFSEKIVAKLYG